jgi:hypothetical protein
MPRETDPTIEGSIQSKTRFCASAKLEGLVETEIGVGRRLSTRRIYSGLRDAFVREEVSDRLMDGGVVFFVNVMGFSISISIQKVGIGRYWPSQPLAPAGTP